MLTKEKAKSRKGQHQASGQWIRTDKRLAIYLRDRFRCVWCNADLTGYASANITLDHIVPQSKGGDNGHTNLVTACRSCNCSRQDRDWRTFGTLAAVKRIQHNVFRPLPIAEAKAILASKKEGK